VVAVDMDSTHQGLVRVKGKFLGSGTAVLTLEEDDARLVRQFC